MVSRSINQWNYCCWVQLDTDASLLIFSKQLMVRQIIPVGMYIAVDWLTVQSSSILSRSRHHILFLEDNIDDVCIVNQSTAIYIPTGI